MMIRILDVLLGIVNGIAFHRLTGIASMKPWIVASLVPFDTIGSESEQVSGPYLREDHSPVNFSQRSLMSRHMS